VTRYHHASGLLLRASGLRPSDVYDAFALTLLPADLGDDARLAAFEGDHLRDKFLAAFLPLLRQQVAKYLGRPDRHDPEQAGWLETAPDAGADELARMFDTATFRSERHRSYAPEDVHNTRWADIARAAGRLGRTSGLDAAREMAGQGGLLNLVHNTETTVLDKLDWDLADALDGCHTGTPADVLAGASPDVRRLLRAHLSREELR